ncbi:hypothetical protein MKX01_011491 [Papaver californicum]|nr:hypothetical protein MKX01_011491 [Papaver californicum]
MIQQYILIFVEGNNDLLMFEYHFIYRVVAVKPLSVLLQTNESENLPSNSASSSSGLANNRKNGHLLIQVNTIGIVGGVLATSTLRFVEKLVEWSSKEGEKNLPFMICSDQVSREQLSPCGCYFHLDTRNACLDLDFAPILQNLRSKNNFLFFIWVIALLRNSKENLKPLEAGSNLRIGVLATDVNLTARYNKKKLQNEGFEVVLPDKAAMEHTIDIEGARILLRVVLQVLLVRDVNVVILASDDMRYLLPPDDPLLEKCIDPMDFFVRSTIKWAHSTRQSQ